MKTELLHMRNAYFVLMGINYAHYEVRHCDNKSLYCVTYELCFCCGYLIV